MDKPQKRIRPPRLKFLKELFCEKVFGGHITDGLRRLEFNDAIGEDEYFIQCLRCKKAHVVDMSTINKYLRPDYGQ